MTVLAKITVKALLGNDMNGSQLTIYANQSHRIGHLGVVDWLLDQAKRSEVTGATVIEASAGIGSHGKYHAARFFELADQPVGVTVVADNALIDRLLRGYAYRGSAFSTPARPSNTVSWATP